MRHVATIQRVAGSCAGHGAETRAGVASRGILTYVVVRHTWTVYFQREGPATWSDKSEGCGAASSDAARGFLPRTSRGFVVFDHVLFGDFLLTPCCGTAGLMFRRWHLCSFRNTQICRGDLHMPCLNAPYHARPHALDPQFLQCVLVVLRLSLRLWQFPLCPLSSFVLTLPLAAHRILAWHVAFPQTRAFLANKHGCMRSSIMAGSRARHNVTHLPRSVTTPSCTNREIGDAVAASRIGTMELEQQGSELRKRERAVFVYPHTPRA